MSGASERANGRASDPVLVSILVCSRPQCAGDGEGGGGDGRVVVVVTTKYTERTKDTDDLPLAPGGKE